MESEFETHLTADGAERIALSLYDQIKPDSQNRSEYAWMAKRIIELLGRRPERFIEIGTDLGNTLQLWVKLLTQDGAITCVDMPYPFRPSPDAEKFREFFLPTQTYLMLRLDSQQESTKAIVSEKWPPQSVDVLFIDGDHSEVGVLRDFELWIDFVKPGGVILFHDICNHWSRPDLQVGNVWASLHELYPNNCESFIETPGQCGMGVGLFKV